MTGQTIDDYVHECHGRWIVATWDQSKGLWFAPIRSELRRNNPSRHTVFSRDLAQLLDHAYSYQRHADAVKRARAVYGVAVND